MATVLNTLYPPQVDTYMPSFVYTENAPIKFSISPYNNITNINGIHITLVDQWTNKNVFSLAETSTLSNGFLANGIYYTPFSPTTSSDSSLCYIDEDTGLYVVEIPSALLQNGFIPGNYYKVQLRFDLTSPPSGESFSSDYFIDNRANFSEWSTVCLIKPIYPPTIELVQFADVTEDSYITPSFNEGIISIDGSFTFGENLDNTEFLDHYQIFILDLDKQEIAHSPIYYTGEQTNKTTIAAQVDLEEKVEENQLCWIRFVGVTNNGYKIDLTKWIFSINTLINFLEVKNQAVNINDEDGCIDISFSVSPAEGEDGDSFTSPILLYIKRAMLTDDKDDTDPTWEVLSCTQHVLDADTTEIKVKFTDWTVGSLKQYRYKVQAENSKGRMSKSCELYHASVGEDKEIVSVSLYPQFYDMVLMRQDDNGYAFGEENASFTQFVIRYDGKIPSVKPTVNRQKVDTLGHRYPKFVENALLNYKVYSISGYISAEGDFNRKFMSEYDYSIAMQKYSDSFNGEFQNTQENNWSYTDAPGAKYLVRNDTVADEEIWNKEKNKIINDILTGYDHDEHIYGEEVALDTETPNNSRGYHNYTLSRKNIPGKKDIDGREYSLHDTYPAENWFWEREFREKAIAWLNDGEPKLFRSMPEGNAAVILTDINLTPNETLGRRIYSFSATLYEVGDGYDLQTLNALGIINLPDVTVLHEDVLEKDEIISNEYEIPGQIYHYNFSQTWNEVVLNETGFPLDMEKSGNISIREKLIKKYEGNPNYVLNLNSLRVKNIRIQFWSRPRWLYNKNNESANQDLSYIPKSTSIPSEIPITENNENLLFGYIFNVYIRNNNTNKKIQIFVNSKGYYQIPEDLIVEKIEFQQEDDVCMDYIVAYNDRYVSDKAVGNVAVVGRNTSGTTTTVGQVQGWYLPNTYLSDSIKQKYLLNYSKNGVKYKQNFSNFNGVAFETDAYALVKIKYTDKTEQTYLIGRTNRLNLDTNHKILDFCFIGRQLFKVEKDRQPFLDEWEFVLSEENISLCDSSENYQMTNRDLISAYRNAKINTVYLLNGESWLYYIDNCWYPIIEKDNQVIAQVPVNAFITYKGYIERVSY